MTDDRFVLTGPLDPAAAAAGDRWVTVHEVGPRDGLQAEPEALPADLKMDFCAALLDAGVTSL